MDYHRWMVYAHVLLFVYWLGPDWGVYVNSRYVADARLGVAERRRFLEAALRIDLVPRSALILLLPLGLQLAANLRLSVVDGPALLGVWVFAIGWLVLSWGVYLNPASARGQVLRTLDHAIRVLLAATLIGTGGWALASGELFPAPWLALKVAVFGVILILGLMLRRVIGGWAAGFRRLERHGSTPETEAVFSGALKRAKPIVYLFWCASALMGFLGVVKPALF